MEYKKITLAAVILLVISILLYFGPALIPKNMTNVNQTTISSNVNFTNEPLQITILTSAECKAFCDTGLVISEIEKRIGKVDVHVLDITNPAAPALVKNYTVNILPVYIVNATSLEKNLNSRTLKDLVRKINNENYVIETIETKKGLIYGRTPTETNVIYYYTSPYTKEAVDFYTENAQLLQNFTNDYTFKYELLTMLKDQKLYPIENGYYFSLNESRRQACIGQLYPKWALSYNACRNKFISSCFAQPQANLDFCSGNWKTCALAYTTFNVSDIEKCTETQGDALLLAMHKTASNRAINAIPTLIVNDQYIAVGQFNSSYIKEQICNLNANATACKT